MGIGSVFTVRHGSISRTELVKPCQANTCLPSSFQSIVRLESDSHLHRQWIMYLLTRDTGKSLAAGVQDRDLLLQVLSATRFE